MTPARGSAAGFSTIEFVLATGITLIVVAAALAMTQSAADEAVVQVEVADAQQRLRGVADTLARALRAAGTGAYAGATPGALLNDTAAILPYRAGGVADDPPGTYKPDTITVLSVPPGSTMVAADTYWWKQDDANATYQLMRARGTGPEVPVADNVVGLRFEYDGDASPPTMETYGPKAPAVAVAPFAAGENCVLVRDGFGVSVPRLPALGAPGTLVRLGAAELGDGPWCPDDGAPNRWDADVLRIRVVHVSVRVQSGLARLRGPAGALFLHDGTSRRGSLLAPDLDIHFQVAPPNLNFGR